jgi:hypothetical protein
MKNPAEAGFFWWFWWFWTGGGEIFRLPRA